MKKTNCFIIGAPKCGTTSLFQYLSEHPEVFSCNPKEPTYFASDFPDFREMKTETDYLNLFIDAQNHHKILLEGSAMYMYSQEALENIKHFNPDAKLIAMVRNPVELTYSYHSQLLYSRDEDEVDFEKAWTMALLSGNRQPLPKFNREPKFLHYHEVAKLGEQIERVLQWFPKQQLMIIFFDDFKKDTDGLYRKTLEFLDLPYHPANLVPLNKNKQQRFQWIANITERPPKILVEPYLQLKKLLNLENKVIGLRNPLMKINESETERQTLSPTMQQKIIDAYREDIQKLASITGRNLNHWLNVK